MQTAQEAARLVRVERYAQWLADDANGIACNITRAGVPPIDGSTTILAGARETLLQALEEIDQAIAADRAAHAATEKEPA